MNPSSAAPIVTIAFIDVVAGAGTGLQVTWPGSAAHSLDPATCSSIDQLLKRLANAERGTAHPSVPALRVDLGKRLFDALDGPERRLARALADQAQEGARLDVVVRLRGPAAGKTHPAATWRFELAADSEGPISCRLGVTLVVQHGGRERDEAEVLPNARLRILFMAYSPEGVRPVLEYEREEETILAALAPSMQQGRAIVHVAEEGSLADLERRLKSDEYDVVYLSGHGQLGEDGPRLIMEDEVGNPDPVDPQRLHGALHRARKMPRLVVLASCETADGSDDVPSMAAALVARGVPAVAGWVRPVRDDDAMNCARDMIERLCAGDPLPEAVAFARRELREADVARPVPSHAWGTLHLATLSGTGFRLDRERPPEPFASPQPSETYRFLGDSQMRVLETGFVGRRRPLQRLQRILRDGRDAGRAVAGACIVGMKGNGKSCLAGRAIHRHVQEVGHAGVAVVHGVLDEASLLQALRDQALRWEDREAEAVLGDARTPLATRVERLLKGRWARRALVLVLDDFEQNLDVRPEGLARVSPRTAELLPVLLAACRIGQPKLVVTTTAAFELPADLQTSLAEIPLGPLDPADVQKLWTRGSEAELAHLLPSDWEQLATRLGRNARVLDWARKLFAGRASDELKAIVAKTKTTLPDWRKRAPDEAEQTRLAALFLLHMAADEARAKVHPNALVLVERARVYTVPVPEAAFRGLAVGLDLDLPRHLPALANLGLLELGQARGERGYQVSALVQSELALEEPERWHRVAAEHWESASRLEDGWHAPDVELAWEHALAAKAEDIADRMSKLLDRHAFDQGLYARNLALAERQLARFSKGFRALWWAGDAANQAGQIQVAGQRFAAAESELLKRSSSSQTIEVAAFLHELGHGRYVQGDLPGARERLERALAILRRALGTEEHPSYATALETLAVVLQAQGDLLGARERLERALAIKRRVLGTEEHPSYAASLHVLAGVLQAQGDLRGARERLERVLAIQRGVLGTDEHPRYAASLHTLAGVLLAQGDLPGARKRLERALAIQRRVLGTDEHPRYAASLHALANVLLAQGDLPGARELLECALAIKLRVLGTEEHPEYAASLHALADVLRAQGDLPGARERLECALAIQRRVLGTEEHPGYAASLHALAGVLQAQGDLPGARELLERSLAITRRVLGTEEHRDYAASLHEIATVLRAQGDLPGALERLERGLAILRRVLGTEEHPDYATSLHALATLQKESGDLAAAEAVYRRVLQIEGAIHGTRDHFSTAETEVSLGFLLLQQGRNEGVELIQHAIAVLQRDVPDHPILQQIHAAAEAARSEPPKEGAG